MRPIEAIANAHVVALPAVAVVAIGVWMRQRTRPSAYLAATFSVLAMVVILGRFPPAADISLIPVLGLLAFAWLLAAFAWSFDGPLPTILRASSIAIVGLVLWDAVASPLAASGASRTVFVVAVVGVWTLLAGAACLRLWRAGSDQWVVRARARAMSVGVATLNLALVLAALPESPATWRGAAVALLALAAATLFLVSFLAPPATRHWWRRAATDSWKQMQVGLLSASTPTEVAAATAPAAAELTGSSVTIVTQEGEVLAHAGANPSGARELGRQLAAGAEPEEHQRLIAVNHCWLVVSLSPHAPVFGRQELAIVEGLARQLELALDRTELAQAHQEALAIARQAKRDVEVLLSGLAHDLRSPSVAIAGYASLLRDVQDAHERAEMIDALEESSSYISSLVDAISELATIGQSKLDVEPVDLGRLVDQVARRLAVQHPDVRVVAASQLPVVLMNASAAEQLLDNLLRNAAVHGGRDDLRVIVFCQPEPDGGATITVSDNGVGIDEDERDHVFEMFHRGQHAASGSGLGLSIARRILASVGGSLRLADPETRSGAAFLLTLPADVVVSRKSATPSEVAPPRPDRSYQG